MKKQSRGPRKPEKRFLLRGAPLAAYVALKIVARLDRRRPDPEEGSSFADSRGERLLARNREGRLVSADVRGSGDAALICIHGWCCHGDFFHYQRELAERVPGLRVVTVDLRGHGSSPGGPADSYSVGGYAEDLRAVIEELGAERFVLMGHSMGGFTAFTFCRLFGDEYRGRLAGLVSLNSTGIHLFHGLPGGERLRARLRSRGFYRFLEKAAARPRPLERLLGMLKRSDLVYLLYRFIGFGPRPSPQMLENIMAMTLGGPVPAMLLDARACLEYSAEDALPGIEVPVLLVAGTKDYMVSPSTNRETRSRLRRAELEFFRSGHGCPLDRSREVNEAVRGFILRALGKEDP